MMDLERNTEATFVNIVKVFELNDIDYTFQFFNIYNGKRWVFKIYKELFDKAMEVRKISPMEIIIVDDEDKKEEIKKKEKTRNNGVGIYA